MVPPSQRSNYRLTIRDIYEVFYKDHRARGKKPGEILTYREYRDVMYDMLLAVAVHLIYDDWVFIMPHKLGTLYIKEYKDDGSGKWRGYTDFNTSKKLGKQVKYLNLHTYGKTYGMKWNKPSRRFKNCAYYTFRHLKGSNHAAKKGVGARGLSLYKRGLIQRPNLDEDEICKH